MQRTHHQKTIIITGAAQGIGLACSERFISEGANVLLVDIQQNVLGQACERLGAQALHYVADLASLSATGAKDIVDACRDAFGRVDGLINNAGILHTEDFLTFPEDAFDAAMNVNLRTPYLLGQAAARTMIAQGDGGFIINMSSVNAVFANNTLLGYAVSKGGLRQMTAVMALSLINHNIRVNAIGPGTMLTDMVKKSIMTDEEARKTVLARTPIGRCGTPDEVAAVASFLADDDASYIVGQTIYADGGRLVLNYTVPVDE